MKTLLLMGLLLLAAGIASAAEVCGVAFNVPARTALALPYEQCTLHGEDAAGDTIHQVFPIDPEGDVVIELAVLFVGRPHPLTFSATCFDIAGNEGLSTEPTGRCVGPGQPEFLEYLPD